MRRIQIRSCNCHFTADTHFSHGNIMKYCHRPFLCPIDAEELKRRGGRWHHGFWKSANDDWVISKESLQIMEDHLVAQINLTVPRDDHLFIVGDFSIARRDQTSYFENCNRILHRINCKHIHIVWGNHDDTVIYPLFETNGDQLRIDFTDLKQGNTKHPQSLFLNHYCQMVWDKSHRGAWHGYGHSHSGIEEALDRLMPGRRSMDFGVDNAVKILGEYRPFTGLEVANILKLRPGYAITQFMPLNVDTPPESESP